MNQPGATTEATLGWYHSHQSKWLSLGAPRHEFDGFVLLAVRSCFHRGLDLHVHAASFTPAHRVQVKPTRTSVAADGAPVARAADVAFADAKGRQIQFHRSGLPAFIDTADRFHVPCMHTAMIRRLSERASGSGSGTQER